MKRLIFFLFFILFSANIFSFDCNSNNKLCSILSSINQNLSSNLIYSNISIPDHRIISDYNSKINITLAPISSIVYSSGNIKNAWLEIITIEPSVMLNNQLYLTSSSKLRIDYDYQILIPEDYYSNSVGNGQICRKLNYLTQNYSDLIINSISNSNKITNFKINDDSQLNVKLNIYSTIKTDHYYLLIYCCSYSDYYCVHYCQECDYRYSSYDPDILSINKSINLYHYNSSLNNTFTFVDNYSKTYKGILNVDNDSNLLLNFENSSLAISNYNYYTTVRHEPYNFLQLNAIKINETKYNNLLTYNNSVYISNINNCTLISSNFFNINSSTCSFNISNVENSEFKFDLFDNSFFKLLLLMICLIILYYIFNKFINRLIILFIIISLFIIPSAFAVDDCSLLNLGNCIPQKMFDFLINVINSPIESFLIFTKNIFITTPDISLFKDIWVIVVYCLSFFYILLFLYSGFQFIIAGKDYIKREKAKEWLKNTVLMIVLIQSSYYIYGLLVEVGSNLTSGLISMVDPHFFMITTDNFVNTGTDFLTTACYLFVVSLTLMALIIRYLIVSIGVLFVPIGFLCYYIPPLRSYGRLILNILGLSIFITVLDALIILACSKLINVPLFQNFQTFIPITCFLLIDLTFVMLLIHIIHKTSLDDGAKNIMDAAKYVGMVAV